MNRKRSFNKSQRHEIKENLRKVGKKKSNAVNAFRRLQILNLYMRGRSNADIADISGYSEQGITKLVTRFVNNGIDAIINDKRTSNNRRMTHEEEVAFLEQFVEDAIAGQVLTVEKILLKFVETTGKESNTETIYKLLKRHGWRKLSPRPMHPNTATDEEIEASKKELKKNFKSLNLAAKRMIKYNKHKKFAKGVLPMFQDEATFGRITDPASCWSPPKVRPEVKHQHVRKYKTVYGAVCPVNGFCLFLVLDKSNSDEMSEFLRQLSELFPDYLILLCLDNASWHTAGKEKLTVPVNIKFFFIPPRTPQMNPIEIVWREIRKRGFKNKMFPSIAVVVDKFIETVDNMTQDDIINLTLWDWVANCFNV